MACEPVNKTKEEVENIIVNRGFIYTKQPNQTVDVTESYLDHTHNNTELRQVPGEETEKYFFFNVKFPKRVSDLSKRYFEERYGGKDEAQSIHNTPDNIVKREGGSVVHRIQEKIMRALADNKQNEIPRIRREALSATDYKMTEAQFNTLGRLAEEVLDQITQQQKAIDPTKKAIIKTEHRIVDPVTMRGGALDVLALFSDNTAAIFDYKTIYRKGSEIEDLVTPSKYESYELTLSEYKRIVKERYYVKDVRISRIVPIHTDFVEKEGKHPFGERLTTTFSRVQAGSGTNVALEQIPVAAEKTKYEDLNKLLEKQNTRLKLYEDKLSSKRLSKNEYDDLQERIKSLRKAIQSTIIRGDVSDIILTVSELINEYRNKAAIPEFNQDGDPNPGYLTLGDVHNFIEEMSVYSDIIENTSSYFKDLKEKNPEMYTYLKTRVYRMSSVLKDTLNEAQKKSDQAALMGVSEQYKDEKGNLLPTDELGFFQRQFNRFSEIDHPVFQSAWKYLQTAQHKLRTDVRTLSDNLSEVQTELFKWAKSMGISRQEAFNKLIDLDKGMIYNKLSKEFWGKRRQAFKNKDFDYIYSIYELRDKEKWLESYNRRRADQMERLKARYNNLEDSLDEDGEPAGPTAAEYERAYKNALYGWERRNDLTTYKEAWLNSRNTGYLKYKEGVEEANESEEYKYIKKHKPLLNFYNFYLEQNKNFRNILGMSNYSLLPDYFIPNIRKEVIEHLSQDGFHFGAAVKEIIDDVANVRSEDSYIATVDNEGNIKRNIPKLFLQPFRNKDGNIDNTRKSYDLGKSMIYFAKMAYNYRYMSEIESSIIALKKLLGDSTPEQGGVHVTDSLGRKIKGRVQEWATKSGIGTDTYKLFENLTDFYLYGIKYKDAITVKGLSLTKLLTRVKQYYSKKTLGFATIPAAGAFIAGKTASSFEGKKGISYTTKQYNNTKVLRAKESKKFFAVNEYFDPYAEDPTERIALKQSANWKSKTFSSRTLFAPLRKVDEWITNHVLVSMMQNFGINSNDQLVRLNRTDVDTKGIKSLWETSKYDPKTGQVQIPGIDNNEANFVSFRQAVRDTTTNIIGSLSQEDASNSDVNLLWNLMMQFKSWMPGIVRERTGKLRYNTNIQGLQWGRFNAFLKDYSLTHAEKDMGIRGLRYFREVFLPTTRRAVLDIMTFGIAPGIKNNRINIERAKRQFVQFQLDNPKLKDVSFEQFLEIKRAQIKALMVELRVLFGFTSLIFFLGANSDDDDTPRYMDNWFTRTIYKTMTKGESELIFMWNPNEFIRLVRNPLPMANILSDAAKTIGNGLDETRDLLAGENSPYDKSPGLYYLVQWMYGGVQLSRLTELYKQYQKSPYMQQNTY